MKVEQLVISYQHSIESLQHILSTTSRKDNDVQKEIKQEISELQNLIEKLLAGTYK